MGSLLGPLGGGGKVWAILSVALIVPAFVIGDYIGIPAKIVWIAALGGFFTSAFVGGASGDPDTIPGPRFDASVLFLSGFVYALLAALAIGPAAWLVSSHAEDVREELRGKLEDALQEQEKSKTKGRDEAEFPREWWRSDESFVFADGHVGVVKGEEPVAVRRIGGGWVLVDPQRHSITALPKGFKPGDPVRSPSSEPAASSSPPVVPTFEALEELSPMQLLSHSRGFSLKLALAIVALLLGLWIVPAALSMAALGSPLDVLALGEAWRLSVCARAPYWTTVSIAAAFVLGVPALVAIALKLRVYALFAVLMVGPSQAAFRLGEASARDGLIIAVALSLGMVITAGFSGWRMGCLRAERPELFPNADERPDQ